MSKASLIRIGLKRARLSDHTHFRHAALILSHGTVIARGHNRGRKHAEAVAISRVDPKKLGSCEILSLRFNRHWELRLAKPCPRCQALIDKHGIKRVRYSDEHGDIAALS